MLESVLVACVLRKTLDSAAGVTDSTDCSEPVAAARRRHTPRTMSPMEPDRPWYKEGPRTSAKCVVVKLRKELACFIVLGASIEKGD